MICEDRIAKKSSPLKQGRAIGPDQLQRKSMGKAGTYLNQSSPVIPGSSTGLPSPGVETCHETGEECYVPVP